MLVSLSPVELFLIPGCFSHFDLVPSGLLNRVYTTERSCILYYVVKKKIKKQQKQLQ